ncbi:MAG: putative pyridoxine 5'-phosphate oxidase superfamily flavin-nucleotide-binding protein [Oleispira sp.]|jgi:predicted pyridoxine 5'-phosphate oxidase superfamily flavin-nucleotide-binding protein
MSVTNNNERITTEVELRKILTSYPKILDKRIQSALDNYSIEFITQASVAALTFSDLTLGMPFLNVKSDQFTIDNLSTISVSIPLNPDHSEIINLPFSLYFLIPGVGHGLRINGKACQIKPINDKEVETKIVLTINSVYLHCARAITRAGLWNTRLITDLLIENSTENLTAKEIIESSPYVLLSTQNAMGSTELSPRGDPAGFVNFIDENHVLLPERPGNKVAVSLTNIINNPAVGLSFLVPGSNRIIYLEGNAHLTTDQALLSPLVIKEKTPKLGIIIAINRLSSHKSSALKSTDIWQKESHISSTALTPFSKALTAHIQGEGLLGKLSHPIMSGIIKHDMNNLY